jgi:hypothetical protein
VRRDCWTYHILETRKSRVTIQVAVRVAEVLFSLFLGKGWLAMAADRVEQFASKGCRVGFKSFLLGYAFLRVEFTINCPPQRIVLAYKFEVTR